MTTETANQKDNIDICAQCYGVIDGAVETLNFGFMTKELRRTLCDRCTFLAGWNKSRLCQRPYKKPDTRPTPDGDAPAGWYEWCREHRKKSAVVPGQFGGVA